MARRPKYACIEDEHSKALWTWAQTVPMLRTLLFHIPNGGKRDPREAKKLKDMGVRAGVSDYCLPVARGEYHGMFLELKVGDNTETSSQQLFGIKVRGMGYYYVVAYGWEAAAKEFTNYLALETKAEP